VPPEQILEKVERGEHPPGAPALPDFPEDLLGRREIFREEQPRVDLLLPRGDHVEGVIVMEQREHDVPDRGGPDAVEAEQLPLRAVAIKQPDGVFVYLFVRERAGDADEGLGPVSDLEIPQLLLARGVQGRWRPERE
jgi:hypothetical protein